jgi:hypothetical protein
MSRRTLERLRQQGLMRVVADRSLVQEALDGVASTALANTFGPTRLRRFSRTGAAMSPRFFQAPVYQRR